MPSPLKKLSHTVYQCKYHIIWVPKYRFKVMDGEIRLFVRDVIRRLCSWKKLEIIQGNVLTDHIHLVLDIPPNTSVSSVVGFLKGKCAIQLFQRFKGLRKKYWGMHFWSTGYFVSTVGVNEEQVVKYVRWQQRKDQEADQQNLFQ
jgi:putative transposase